MRKRKEVQLASFLPEQPDHSYKEVNLVRKGITQLGDIPPFVAGEVESLILRDNKLMELG
jgi:hypothetical protein